MIRAYVTGVCMRHITTCPIGARHFICRRAKTGKVHTEPAEWLLHDRGLQNACVRACAMRVSESKNTTGVLAHTRPMYSKYMSFCCCGGAVGSRQRRGHLVRMTCRKCARMCACDETEAQGFFVCYRVGLRRGTRVILYNRRQYRVSARRTNANKWIIL